MCFTYCLPLYSFVSSHQAGQKTPPKFVQIINTFWHILPIVLLVCLGCCVRRREQEPVKERVRWNIRLISDNVPSRYCKCRYSDTRCFLLLVNKLGFLLSLAECLWHSLPSARSLMGPFSWVIRQAETENSEGRWAPSWPSRILSGKGTEAVLMQWQGWTQLGRGPTGWCGFVSVGMGWVNHPAIRNQHLGKSEKPNIQRPALPPVLLPGAPAQRVSLALLGQG